MRLTITREVNGLSLDVSHSAKARRRPDVRPLGGGKAVGGAPIVSIGDSHRDWNRRGTLLFDLRDLRCQPLLLREIFGLHDLVDLGRRGRHRASHLIGKQYLARGPFGLGSGDSLLYISWKLLVLFGE